MPVVDSTGTCIGIIALGDIARAAATQQTIDDEEARSDADVGV